MNYSNWQQTEQLRPIFFNTTITTCQKNSTDDFETNVKSKKFMRNFVIDKHSQQLTANLTADSIP